MDEAVFSKQNSQDVPAAVRAVDPCARHSELRN
jgi:hypothetical protein